MSLQHNQETFTPTVETLVKQLGSRNASQREQAEQALRCLGSEEIDQLVRLARTAPRKAMFRMIVWFGVIAWPMIFLPAWVTFGLGSSVPAPLRWLTFAVFLGAYVPLFTHLVARPRFQNDLCRSLTLVDDIRVLGPLIASFAGRIREPAGAVRRLRKVTGWREGQREELKTALLRLLSRIQPDDTIDLVRMERLFLVHALRSSDPEVVVALLRLLEQIGNSQDLAHVRKLESGLWLARTDPAVRDAAHACRVAIEARLADNAITGTLLRASEPTIAAETLVRPAIATLTTEPTQLLRATHHNDTPEV